MQILMRIFSKHLTQHHGGYLRRTKNHLHIHTYTYKNNFYVILN
jgi:hypothetical protein